jgi:PTH1 family peptidyl-tRNA hydrolase
MIHATIRMTLPARKAEEAEEILGFVAERTRIQPGCISFRLYHDAQEQNVIMVEGVWRSQEELESHLRSEEYRNVLLVVEMASQEPEIRFDEISQSTGLETIEKARREGKGGGKAQ